MILYGSVIHSNCLLDHLLDIYSLISNWLTLNDRAKGTRQVYYMTTICEYATLPRYIMDGLISATVRTHERARCKFCDYHVIIGSRYLVMQCDVN